MNALKTKKKKRIFFHTKIFNELYYCDRLIRCEKNNTIKSRRK